jgi:hypothetical protein
MFLSKSASYPELGVRERASLRKGMNVTLRP